MAGENDPSTQDPIGNVTGEDGLMELFSQFSSMMSAISDKLKSQILSLSSVKLLYKGKHYLSGHSSKPNNNSSTGHRVKYIRKILQVITLCIKLLKVCTHKVTSACGTNLDPTGQSVLTFRVGNRQFKDRFVIL